MVTKTLHGAQQLQVDNKQVHNTSRIILYIHNLFHSYHLVCFVQKQHQNGLSEKPISMTDPLLLLFFTAHSSSLDISASDLLQFILRA